MKALACAAARACRTTVATAAVATAAALALTGWLPAQAAPVHLEVQSGGFSLAAGNSYGGGPNKLGVIFTPVDTAVRWTADLLQGQSFTFRFGSVGLGEESSDGVAGGGSNATLTTPELQQLGVSALFSFFTPAGLQNATLGSTVTATAGDLDDAAVDYALAWEDLVLDLGSGARLGLTMSGLSFTRNHQSAEQYATVTLLQAGTLGTIGNQQAVAEPGSLALAGLALVALGVTARRHQAPTRTKAA